MKDSALGHIELTSAGGVVYRRNHKGAEFAFIRVGEQDRWQLPKGLVDEGETLEEAALREVREETGLTCRIISPLSPIDYWFTASYEGPSTRYHKHVHFFVMEFVSGDVADHDHEVEEVRWFGEDAALSNLVFDSERKIVSEAMASLAEEAS